MNQLHSKKIFVLALDGTPYSLLKRFALDGIMPNVKNLITAENFRSMNSVLPSVSSVAWSSFMTGKNPLHHGIYGFIDRYPKTMDVYVPDSRHQKGQTLWEYLSEKGKRIFVMNVPATYPPRKVNGILIGGFLGTDILKNTYPAKIGLELKNSGYRIDVDTIRAREDIEGFIQELWYTYEKRVETLWRYFNSENWDFFMAHIMETDRLHHFLWEYWENGDLRYTDIFIKFYRMVDDLIGKILDKLPQNIALMILSDHGFTTLRKEVFLNKWLFDKGYLKFTPGDVPDSLHHLHPDTVAYSLIPGRIYLNLKGREKTGSISPGLEYERIRQELKADLSELKDSPTGENLVSAVFTPQEIFESPNSVIAEGTKQDIDPGNPYYLAPDLIVLPEKGYDFKGNLWRQNLTEKGPIVGTHTFDDAFVFVKDQNLKNHPFSITDMMPTILELMGLAPPGDLDGGSILIN